MQHSMHHCRDVWPKLALVVVVVVMAMAMGANAAERSPSTEASVRLNQGMVIGLKVFPESSRTPVYSYLGVPYAEPPMGALRFAVSEKSVHLEDTHIVDKSPENTNPQPPKPHAGWNRTLYARNYQAICPQPDLNMFEESSSGYPYQSRMSENCLFLNVWTSESCLRFGHCPVLAIITGEEQAFDWTRNRPSGLDLAAEGLVVITIQARTNIFGWLTTGDASAPGNLALRDQQLALHWIQVNVPKFGGAADQVTLLGHGTSGAANAMIHLVNPTSTPHFSKLILMSGTVFSPWSFQVTRNAASTSLAVIRNLACEAPSSAAMLQCVRQKSARDLLHAFENVHQNGNYTRLLGPEVDRYLPESERWLRRDPRALIEAGEYPAMPIMVGICSNEGAFLREQWLELGRESYAALSSYVQKTLIANALHQYGFRGAGAEAVRDTINWRFFDQTPNSVTSLLDAMQRFQSEVRFEKPFYETVEHLLRKPTKRGREKAAALVAQHSVAGRVRSYREDAGIMEHRSVGFDDDDGINDDDGRGNEDSRRNKPSQTSNLFVYSFQQPGTIDLRGRPNYFGGAAHTADLLFLMGPSLYQQIGRRKLTGSEEKLCKRMRQTFADFVKTGNPTPGRLFDAWHPYSEGHRYVQVLGSPDAASPQASTAAGPTYLHTNHAQIADMLSGGPSGGAEVTVSSADLAVNPYAIGQRKIDTSVRHSKSYLPAEPVDSAYTLAMGRVHAFWSDLLPRMYAAQQQQRERPDNERQDAEAGAELAAKFRHAFFSMLALVCVLLAMLGVCVYILRKGHRHIDTSYL